MASFFERRRRFLSHAAFFATACATPGLLADELMLTPSFTEGPFYPDKLPLDTDNDLLVLNDSLTPAIGKITHLTGRVLSRSGTPIRNAFVEIWQCDNNGAYLHPGSSNLEQKDSNFQGYGRFLTDSKGQYYFRTIKPVPYPGRTPHIHYAISKNGQRLLTTQLFVQGERQNETDGLFRAIQNPKARAAVLADFAAIPDSPIGELAAEFDLVIGTTPDEGAIKGVPKPLSRRG